MKAVILAMLVAASLAAISDYPNTFYDGSGFYSTEVPKEGRWSAKVVIPSADLANVASIDLHVSFYTISHTGLRELKLWTNTDAAVVDVSTTPLAKTDLATYTFNIVKPVSCTSGDCTVYITLSATCDWSACLKSLTTDIYTQFKKSDATPLRCFASSCAVADRYLIVPDAEMMPGALASTSDANYWKFNSLTAKYMKVVVNSGLLSRITLIADTDNTEPTSTGSAWFQTTKIGNQSMPSGTLHLAVRGNSAVPFSDSTSYHLCFGDNCNGAAALSALVALLAAFFAML